jgi:hypothetical protein
MARCRRVFRFQPARLELQPSAKAAHAARDQRNQKQHQGDEEHDLGDADSRARDSAKAQDRCDQGNDQQSNDKAQHFVCSANRLLSNKLWNACIGSGAEVASDLIGVVLWREQKGAKKKNERERRVNLPLGTVQRSAELAAQAIDVAKPPKDIAHSPPLVATALGGFGWRSERK